MNLFLDALQQLLYAAAFYVALLVMLRLSGKRHAGQMTTFDLLVLITLAVVLQSVALQPGTPNKLVFVVGVYVLHRGVAMACLRSPWFCALVRGKPRTLVRDGQIDTRALRDEGVTEADLRAGLRKLGIERPEDVKLAALEETGQVSAVPMRR